MKPEQIAQINLFNWIVENPELKNYCFSIPNERKTSAQQGALLKRMGLMPGVSDVFIAIPKGKYHGMFLELKEGKNKPTKSQINFLQNMKKQGYASVWCVGYENAKKIIINYMELAPKAGIEPATP